MRITICASSAFRREMVEYKDKLEKMGHTVFVHDHYIKSARGEMPELMERIKKEHAALKKEHDYIRAYHNEIIKSDAILVLNFEKNGIKNYIGGNVLMEMGFAHANYKKIYLLNSTPKNVSYLDEIEAMNPIILGGDIKKIKKNKSQIVLATTSPYRIEAFKMLEIDFEAIGSYADEKFPNRPNDPQKLVSKLAKRKAEAVAKKCKNKIIIGFDSVGYFRGKILEKPENFQEGIERLRALSGNKFQFHTGVYIIDQKKKERRKAVITTEAEMRKLSAEEIRKYLKEDPGYLTYALGFDPLFHSSAGFIKYIKGSYNNILRGIPLEEIVNMLKIN